jgi:hypothetical protein
MADVFLSYRRDDSRSATGRLADSLQAVFGPESVFRDLDSIAPGQDFEAALARAIGGASVMLAVIGPRWTDMRDAQGRRRLDDPRDVVRREIEAALAAGLPVLPVLVEGARMPAPEQLPASLAAFARCQAIGLDDAGWRDRVARLVAELQQRHGLEPVGSAAAGAAPRWNLLEVFELVARPRRVLLRLAGDGGSRTLSRVMVLLVACLLAGNLLSGLPVEPGLGLVGWVLNGTLLGLIAALFVIGVVSLAWRLAGVRVGWQRVAAGAACVLAGAWLFLAAGQMVFELGWAMAEPGVFAAVLERWRSRPEAGFGDWAALSQKSMRGTALAGLLLASVFWLAGFVWLAAAWNALRLALGARWWQAIVAAAAVGALLTSLALAARWAASG